jgi:predicted transcriptional regulator
MPRQPSKTFTDKELEIMRVVWELGEATAKQIQEQLSGDSHYNSVLTIIRVLERKGHLTHRAEGRAHIYRARQQAEKARNKVLSHLISQNTTIRNSLKLTDQAWFSEGIAVWFGDQKAYLSREEFLEKAKTADLTKVIDPARMDRESPDWSARFAYPAQRYFLEYLKQTHSADCFHNFLVKYIHAPDDYQKLFTETYQQSLTDTVRQFEQALRSGEWLPQ